MMQIAEVNNILIDLNSNFCLINSFSSIPPLPPKTHFIKIIFIIQGLDLLNISDIFRDHRVTCKIPQHFENLDPSLICYQDKNLIEIPYSTTTKSLLTLMFVVLFGLLAFVRTLHFCIHMYVSHVVTGDLTCIPDKGLRSLFSAPEPKASLKPLNESQRNLTGSKISMSSTKFVFFGLIGKTRWPPWPLIG